MTFLVLAHIDTGNHVLVIEQKLGESLCKLGLADTGGTHEQERTDRSLFIGQSRTASAHSVCYCADGLLLTNDSLVEFFLHTEQFLLFAFEHTVYRYACPS